MTTTDAVSDSARELMDAVYRETAPAISRWLWIRGVPEQAHSDVMQEAYTRVLRRLRRNGTTADVERLVPEVWRAIRWAIADSARQDARARARHEPLSEVADHEVISLLPGPEEQALARVSRLALAAGLANLPEPRRRLVVDRYVLDVPCPQLAAESKRRPGAIRKELSRSLKALSAVVDRACAVLSLRALRRPGANALRATAVAMPTVAVQVTALVLFSTFGAAEFLRRAEVSRSDTWSLGAPAEIARRSAASAVAGPFIGDVSRSGSPVTSPPGRSGKDIARHVRALPVSRAAVRAPACVEGTTPCRLGGNVIVVKAVRDDPILRENVVNACPFVPVEGVCRDEGGEYDVTLQPPPGG